MPSKQIISYGGTVERSTDGSTWAEIPECEGVGVPVVTTDYQDVTSLDSDGGFREYIRGLKDIGEITLVCGYTAAGYEQQLADQAAADAIYYRITMKAQPDQSTGDVFEYRGFPTPELQAGGIGDPVKMNVQIRGTGAPEWTRGTAA